MKNSRRMSWFELLNFYHGHLLHDVIPFWLKHAIDWEYGGIFTGIADDGSLITDNKYVWSNARAIYTFSAIYNYVEADPKYLEAARNIYDFCFKYGREENGAWGFLTDRKGKMLEGEKAIQVDAFAIMGLTEYARATGDKKAIQLAEETFRSVKRRLAIPGGYGSHPYPIPDGAKAHRDNFQFALAFLMLGTLTKNEEILNEAYRHAEEVMENFRRPDRKVLLEYISLDNEILDSPKGRVMNPGHAVESMWFMIHIYRHFNNEERIAQAIETMKWGLEKGWDPVYGGIYHAIDIDGKAPVGWVHPDKKIWWVFTEALYALLLAYEHCGQDWCLDWYWKVHDWAFEHYPVAGHGEWTQKLERDGRKFEGVVALPVKDPFHLPRAMVLCIDVLRRLNGRP